MVYFYTEKYFYPWKDVEECTMHDFKKGMSGIKHSGLQRGAAVIFWIIVWQIASILIGEEILLASPIRVCETLAALVPTKEFWMTAAVSFGRIVSGFILATICGILLSVLASFCKTVRILLSPLMLLFKAVPVASFIILVLLWTGSRGLSVVISFLMVLPVIYTNTLEGILHTDVQLLEMAKVYRLRWYQKFRAIYLPDVLPYFSSACSISIGLGFKSGIAAEVIGLPNGSIGERLYQAKIHLSTGEVLAWTVVIVLLTVCFEYLVKKTLKFAEGRLCR